MSRSTNFNPLFDEGENVEAVRNEKRKKELSLSLSLSRTLEPLLPCNDFFFHSLTTIKHPMFLVLAQNVALKISVKDKKSLQELKLSVKGNKDKK
jgi:hypothetical protein